MPRSGGNYTLPEPPFVPNTVISSSAMNSDLTDIADALTASLARDGQGGMTAVLPLVGAGFNYTVDPDTGIRRSAANTQQIYGNGLTLATIGPTAANFAVPLQQNGSRIIPIGLGPLPWSGLTAPPLWILCYGQTLLRSAYPDLWAFAQLEISAGNTLYNNGDGSTTFGVADLRGRSVSGKDDMGGTAANRLTNTTMTPDGNTLGAVGGDQVRAILQANLPDVDFDVDIPAGQGAHNHQYVPANLTNSVNQTSADRTVVVPNSVVNTSTSTLPAMTGTAASGGSGTSFNIVQPTILANYIIFAGV